MRATSKASIKLERDKGSTRIISKPEDIFTLFLIWMFLTSVAPFTFFVAIPHHPHRYVTVLVGLLCGIFLIFRRKIIISPKIVFFIISTQAFFFLIIFAPLHYLLTEEFNANGYTMLSLQYISILIIYVYTSTYYSIYRLARSYIYLILFMGFLGWIAFILGLSGIGLMDIATTHQNPDARGAHNFWLTFSNAIWPYGKQVFIRVAGFFDEPGTFAYHITFAMLINRIREFSRKTEFYLILAGIPTVSLAYFISLSLYITLFYFDFKKIKYLLVVMIVTAFLIVYVGKNKDQNAINNIIYRSTLGRLERASSDGQFISGDNRTRLLMSATKAFQESPLIGHGIGYNKNPQSRYRGKYLGSNIISPLAIHGIVGAIFIFLPFIYWTRLVLFSLLLQKTLIFAWIIVALNFFQRPDLIGPVNYFALIFLIDSTIYRLKLFRHV